MEYFNIFLQRSEINAVRSSIREETITPLPNTNALENNWNSYFLLQRYGIILSGNLRNTVMAYVRTLNSGQVRSCIRAYSGAARRRVQLRRYFFGPVWPSPRQTHRPLRQFHPDKPPSPTHEDGISARSRSQIPTRQDSLGRILCREPRRMLENALMNKK